MATVPEGKTIWIGNKQYKAGDQLPALYKEPVKKSAKKDTADKQKELV